MKHFIELTPFRTYLDRLREGPALLREMQRLLLLQPDDGEVVQGTGGIRKMRLAGKGRGKRGGYRIWYLYLPEPERIYLLAIYSKNEIEDLTAAQRQELRGLVEMLKQEARREKK